MARTLVDTSVWVEALRERGDPGVRSRIWAAIRADQVVLCDMVRLELWNGVRGAVERRVLAELDDTLHRVETSAEVWNLAVRLARRARAAGLRAPASDLLVVACARHYQLELDHRDTQLTRLLEVV